MGIDADDDAGEQCREEINIRQLSYRKATEKKRIPDNLDDVIGGEQEKQKSRHETDPPDLTGADIEKLPNFDRQRAKYHSANILLTAMRTEFRLRMYSREYDKSNGVGGSRSDGSRNEMFSRFNRDSAKDVTVQPSSRRTN